MGKFFNLILMGQKFIPTGKINARGSTLEPLRKEFNEHPPEETTAQKRANNLVKAREALKKKRANV